MEQNDFGKAAEFLSNNLRLRTLPLAVKFLKDKKEFPEKTRQPSIVFKKKVTICQGVTMARLYGWTVGLTKEDLICVPAIIAFGMSPATDPADAMGKLFCEMDFEKGKEGAAREVASMVRLENGEYDAIALSPLQRGLYAPDTVVIYGNPAQVMRLVQATVYELESRIAGNFGGKVECTEYLLAPFKTRSPRVAIPGNGDRIFSMTQDDEMIFALPGEFLQRLVNGLKESGKRVGTRYPVTFYQNFQPEFPKAHVDLGNELGIL